MARVCHSAPGRALPSHIQTVQHDAPGGMPARCCCRRLSTGHVQRPALRSGCHIPAPAPGGPRVRYGRFSAHRSAWHPRHGKRRARCGYRCRCIPGRMQTLRDIIDVKKWEINQAAGRYIRAHEAVQRISIRNRLNDFMQAHGTELAATLAPELMGLSQQPALLTGHALDRSAHYLREALSVWLSTGEEINYAAEDSDILTAIGFRPDAASRVDNQEKYTPAQSLIYARRRTELAGR
uniref:Phage polarity suppression protein n=12 Tax=Klebsiella pneumoniae complex TaxID=3390273 RepID=E5F8U5_KLEPN|nr:phage polarity suppression protein [Klebsiella pneumoniae subsp. pneumoniae]